MKFTATALLVLFASVASLASEYDGRALIGRNLLDMGEGKQGEKDNGKKGDMDGGKKGDVEDCTDDTDPIIACDTVISKAGRYVLDGILKCGANEFGIRILADNVHLDCLGNQIQGGGQNIGIAIGGASHVTVSKCHVTDFGVGLDAFRFNGL
jgi:hypothetical protein